MKKTVWTLRSENTLVGICLKKGKAVKIAREYILTILKIRDHDQVVDKDKIVFYKASASSEERGAPLLTLNRIKAGKLFIDGVWT
jgi:hypothetical protein